MERRLIIKEDERNEILNLHRKYVINEVGPGGIDPNLQQNNVVITGTTTTGTTTDLPKQTTTIQPGIKNPKVETLQNKLNEKFKSGLLPDGKWGPKTAAAVQKALVSLTPASGTTPAAGTTPATGTTPAAGTK